MISVKKILAADVVRISSLNAVALVIKMLASFVTIKVVATMSSGDGPAAIAMLGTLNNFATIVLGICNGGITNGMTRYIAEYATSDKKNQLFLGTGFWITSSLSIVIGLSLILFAGFFSQYVLSSPDYKGIFYIFGSTVIMYSLNALLIAVINGFKEFKKYVIANILGSLTGLVFTLVLSKSYGIYGALIAVVTYQSVVFLVTLSLVSKSKWFKWRSFTKKFSKVAAVKLSHYSLMALVTAIVLPASQLIIRKYISTSDAIKSVGMHKAGIWEGMNRISNMYLLVFATSLGVYYLPRLTELNTRGKLRQEVFSVAKIIAPFLLVFSTVIYFMRFQIIHIIFTNEFKDMEGLFAFQLLGDFLKMLSWTLAYIMVAKSMTKTFIIMEFVSYSSQVAFNILFFNIYGLEGAPMGYAAGHLLYLICMLVIFRKMVFGKSDEGAY